MRRRPIPVIPAVLLAIILGISLMPNTASADLPPMISASVNGRDVGVSIFVNGVPVYHFSAGGGPLNLWLVNGPNEVEAVVEPVGADPAAEVTVRKQGHDGPLATYVWSADEPRFTITVEADGLPEWAWLRATPAEPAGLEAAVAATYQAIADGDLAAFQARLSGYVGDIDALLGAGQGEQMVQSVFGQFGKGLAPLPELTVTHYRDGQVFSVVDGDGNPPFRATADDGTIFSFGPWWGMVDGTWQILR